MQTIKNLFYLIFGGYLIFGAPSTDNALKAFNRMLEDLEQVRVHHDTQAANKAERSWAVIERWYKFVDWLSIKVADYEDRITDQIGAHMREAVLANDLKGRIEKLLGRNE